MSEELSLEMPTPAPSKPPQRAVFIVTVLSALAFAVAGCAAWLLLGRTALPHGVVYTSMTPISAPVSAKVVEVFVRDGETVRAGAPLVRLDMTAYSRYVAEARALVRNSLTAQAQNAGMRQQMDQLRAQEDNLVQRLAEARFAEEDARSQVEQYSLNHARAALQRRELDIGGADATKRRTALQAEQAALAAQKQAKAHFERVSRARSGLEQEIRHMRENFTASVTAPPVPAPAETEEPLELNPVVTAPVAGVVHGTVEVGQSLDRNSSNLYISPPVAWQVVAQLPEDMVAQLEKGQMCSVTLPAPNDRTVWGTIEELPQPVPVHGTLPPPVSPASPLTGTDLQGGAQLPVVISILPGTTLTPPHGTSAQVYVWRHSLPGFKALCALFS